MLSISKCCCQFRLSCSLFFMPDTCRGEFLFFLPNQRKWISKKPCCYNCGTPPALFWPNPLPSSVNPCEGILVPKGWPCVGFMPFWNTCEQGDTQALSGFPSPPQLEVLPPPCNHTVSSPSAGVQWEEILLLAKKICFRTGCWGCDCYPSDCSKVPDNIILPMPRCILLCWPGGRRRLCHSVTVT